MDIHDTFKNGDIAFDRALQFHHGLGLGRAGLKTLDMGVGRRAGLGQRGLLSRCRDAGISLVSAIPEQVNLQNDIQNTVGVFEPEAAR